MIGKRLKYLFKFNKINSTIIELEPLENWVKMFTEEGENNKEGEDENGEKEETDESPDFHVVIALHPVSDPIKKTQVILSLIFNFIFYEYLLSLSKKKGTTM